MEQLLELVRLELRELTSDREAELARDACVRFDLNEINAAIADGSVYAAAGDIAPRPRALGARRGLELRRRLHAQRRGVTPS